MNKVGQFVRSVSGDWIAMMSGGVGLLLSFAAKFWTANVVPDIWLWTACIGCVLLASFRVWAKEFDRAEAASRDANAAALREAVTHAQNEIHALKKRIAGVERRHVTPDQRSAIAARIRPLTEQWKALGKQFQVFVAPVPNAEDSVTYAGELADVLESVGFLVSRDAWNGLRIRITDNYNHGLWLRRNEKAFVANGWPRFDEALHRALIDAGIAVILQEHESAERIDLIVGARE